MERVELLERACADAWPALVDEPLGQWRMRAAGGFTGRANSTLVLGSPDRPVLAALRAATGFAARHGIPARTQVPVGSPTEADLAAAGWRPDDDHSGPDGVLVMTGPVTGLTGDVPDGVDAAPAPTEDCWPLLVGADRPTAAQRHVLTAGDDVAFGMARRSGRLAGVVRGAVVGDLLHISRLAVAPEFRRRGLARAVLAATAAWASDRGARRYALQVTGGNHGAIALYRDLGGSEHHRYRYWLPSTR
jgi:ribosomal protein S18 acetylase RimI-like enzyme